MFFDGINVDEHIGDGLQMITQTMLVQHQELILPNQMQMVKLRVIS